MTEGIIVGVAVAAITILINALVRRAGAQARQEQTKDSALTDGMRSILHLSLIHI